MPWNRNDKGGRNLNYGLLDNGLDSLKAAFKSINNFYEHDDSGDHFLKDSIIFLNHGNEILLKYLISLRSHALLFADIDKYLLAKEDAIKAGKSDVFEVAPKLRTITLEEAIKRTEYACDLQIPTKLKAAIFYLLKVRNKLMHYGLSLKQEEVGQLVDMLEICYEESIKFFSSQIEDFEEVFESSRFILTDMPMLQRQYDKLIDEMESAAISAMEDGYNDYLTDQADAMERNG